MISIFQVNDILKGTCLKKDVVVLNRIASFTGFLPKILELEKVIPMREFGVLNIKISKKKNQNNSNRLFNINKKLFKLPNYKKQQSFLFI